MSMYVAFLRGINLGRRRVKNEQLCDCFEKMGFGNVSAFLASGNVLFSSRVRSSSKLELTIEKGLEQCFSYEVRTFVRSSEAVVSIAGQRPFDENTITASTGKLQVAILANVPTASGVSTALALATQEDRLHVDGREVYWLPKGNMSASELDLGGLAAALGTMTLRTQRTMIRLSAKLVG